MHAAHDREPYVLKFDLDSVLILALMRRGRDHFTPDDLSRGFITVTKMLADRRDWLPVCSVSFLNGGPTSSSVRAGRSRALSRCSRRCTMPVSGGRLHLAGDVEIRARGRLSELSVPRGVERMRAGSS